MKRNPLEIIVAPIVLIVIFIAGGIGIVTAFLGYIREAGVKK